ncbi:helix-turn-helix transcriptional regulator [Leucobacter weissii]|uniref:Helix-turn-helix transcriptional regulator n=1 Tax=Leucobacter weissii TaxID=1983706 RepID=A0A939MMF8_9MICO|nr:helix-turn-helix domain-containing protein [Leucobacter weissii]MBO1902565.1 helix-turn-helix transcriptional regulator [Leucobacter weissii]
MSAEGTAPASPPRRSRRRPGENRERLIEAGIAEFARLGYRGASTVVIAERAEVPQPHVYASFRTKRELFLACVDRIARESLDAAASDETRALVSAFLLQSVASRHDAEVGEEVFDRLLSPLLDGLGPAELSDRIGRAAIARMGFRPSG